MTKPEPHWLTPKADKPGEGEKSEGKPRRHRRSAWAVLLPIVVLLGLAALFAYAFRDRLLPGLEVEFVEAGESTVEEVDVELSTYQKIVEDL